MYARRYYICYVDNFMSKRLPLFIYLLDMCLHMILLFVSVLYVRTQAIINYVRGHADLL